MRVLVVTQMFWPETFRINDVVASLRDAGADVHVLTGKPNYPDGAIFPGYRAWGTSIELYRGASVHRVPLVPRGKASAPRLVMNYLSFLLCACLLGPWLLRRQRFDVIFVYGTSPIFQAIAGILLKVIKRCPMVLWVQDLWPESLSATGFIRSARLLKIVDWMIAGIYRCSDLVLVQSQAFVARALKYVSADKVVYHPNPGSSSGKAPERRGPAIQLGQGFNVVFAGNLGTVQALETIVEAAARLAGHPNIRFVLVGSGSRGEWLRAEVKRRDLRNVELPGRFPPEEMPAILSRASALLVSLSRSEIFRLTIPSKVQEYLAAGRPIVASLDGEGARIVAEAGAGKCAPAEDPVGLARVIEGMSLLPLEELARMGKRGRDYYEAHFDPARLAKTLLKHFDQAIGTRTA